MDQHRIEVGISENKNLKNAIIHDLKISAIQKVETIDVYTLDGGNLTAEELHFLGQEVFSDPIVDKFSIDQPLLSLFEGSIVEIGFKPGVTDNVGMTAIQAVKDSLKKDLKGIYASRQYILYGISPTIAEKITKDFLANQLIERWQIIDGKKYQGFPISIPNVILQSNTHVEEINLNVSDEALIQISQQKVLALNLEEMKAVQKYYQNIKNNRRQKGLPENPTDIELEAIAQTWSEHCKHKIFNAQIEYHEANSQEIIDSVFKTYIRKATEEINSPYLVSVFKDNAGIIKLNDQYGIALKVETHNSPTALDPYGGALTGIVGCNRDPAGTGKGFKLLFNTDVFCFASPFYDQEIPPRLFHPLRVLKGVHKGIIDGGNQSGIPTVNGSLYFDKRFLGKPLVFCGTGGIAPLSVNGKPSHEKQTNVGDLVVMVGGRIGADGIHGATFSSLEINEHSPATAVQIGAPIVQKTMLDFLIEARNKDLFNSITDNGAGGLSSSIGEMGEDTGVKLYLEKCPLKYPGLCPWEILLSEAQERMSLAIPPEKITEFLNLAQFYEIEANVIGEFTNTHHFELFYNNVLIGDISMDFLHNGVPQMKLKGAWKPTKKADPQVSIPQDYTLLFKQMLGRLNICSKENAIVRRYDHEVQGGSIIKPFTGIQNDGPSDAAVIRPLFSSWEGIAVSHGICPRYSDIDCYAMVAAAIDEAVRNAVCVGADPQYMAGLDNFCWAMGYTKEDEIKYTGDLVRANKALYELTKIYQIPCISGKDSMRNDYRIGNTTVSVPPTMMFTLIGKLSDVRKAITMDVKQENDLVYILGLTKEELGASEYFDHLHEIGSSIPQVDSKKAFERYKKLHHAIQFGIVRSCHDCSDGGLGVTLAEMAFAGGLGLEIDLSKVPTHNLTRDDFILFSESQSRIILTISPQNQQQMDQILNGTEYGKIGIVTGKNLVIHGVNGKILINCPILELKDAWQRTLGFLAGEGN